MSKLERYNGLVKALFELLDTVEQTDEGREFRPTAIRSCRSDHVEKLDQILKELKTTLKTIKK
jgi:hypothetical protein